MKKHILILMLVILVFTGCRNNSNTHLQNQSESIPVESTQTDPDSIFQTESENSEPENLETTLDVIENPEQIETEATIPLETQASAPTESEATVPAEMQVPEPTETEPAIPPETEQTEPEETDPTIPPSTESTPTETEPQQSEPASTDPERSGDIYSSADAMATGNSYAVSAHGMSVDYSLGFSNASYEFADSAYVSGLKVLGGQSYLNQMVIQKIDSLVANLRGAYGEETDISAYRVNCWVEYDDDGELYWIYVFYG